jgi:Skp family chaperone for outer membrane proteins
MRGGGERRLSRRVLLAGAIGAIAAVCAAVPVGPGARAQPAREFVVVSRERILRDAAAARRLRTAEEEMTASLQAQIDATKLQFAEEEEELTRLRGELPAAAFEARIADFDQRVRHARRVAQERAAALQKGFQDARASIVAVLPALMERLRIEAGARIVVNADQVLAADRAADLTERAIALFDAEGPAPAIPDVDLSRPLSEPQPQLGSEPHPGSSAASGTGPATAPPTSDRPAATAPGR